MSQPAWRDRAALHAENWSGIGIDGAIRNGRLLRVARGIYLPASAGDDLWQRCGAALSTQHEEAAISRRTSALAHGFEWLPDSWAEDAQICVDAPREDLTRSSRRGLDRRLSALPAEDVAIWRGLRICTPARTAVDLARFEPAGIVVPILDWLLTKRVCGPDDLVSVMDRMVRVPNVRRARQLVGRARAGADSPRETHVRLGMVDAGLPEPDINLVITEEGVWLAQGDLGYWRWLIWIEYDGVESHVDRRMDGRDQAKDRWLRARGWEVFRVTNRDHHSPGAFHSEVRQAIREAPTRIAALSASRSPEVAAARIALGLDLPHHDDHDALGRNAVA
jgi:hypothetical protein